MKTKKKLEKIKREWKNGKWDPAQEPKELWGGAGLIVWPEEREDSAIVVVTRYAYELSALIVRIHRAFSEDVDYLNKYELFPRLGVAANRAINKSGDGIENIFNAVLKEALDIANEWSMRLYFAYGSNMDESQMEYRCKGARLLGKAFAEGYGFALDSDGVATIIPKDGDRVEGLLWLINDENEESLDRYEGVASGCYRKEYISVVFEGRLVLPLVYLSNRSVSSAGYRNGYMQKIQSAAIEHDFSAEYVDMLGGWIRRN